jgi:lycopene cyclase domain-containing protein
VTYWALNAFFLVAVAVAAVLAILRGRRSGDAVGQRAGVSSAAASWPAVSWPAVGLTAALLLVMTAVFDNIMIGVGLVGYNESLISGAFIGIAPLEDFAYTVAAVVLLPSLWALLPVSSGSASAPTDSASAPRSGSPSGRDA